MDRIQELNDQIAERDEIEKRVESCIRVVFGRIAELEAAVVVLKRRLVVAEQKLKGAGPPGVSITASAAGTEVHLHKGFAQMEALTVKRTMIIEQNDVQSMIRPMIVFPQHC